MQNNSHAVVPSQDGTTVSTPSPQHSNGRKRTGAAVQNSPVQNDSHAGDEIAIVTSQEYIVPQTLEDISLEDIVTRQLQLRSIPILESSGLPLKLASKKLYDILGIKEVAVPSDANSQFQSIVEGLKIQKEFREFMELSHFDLRRLASELLQSYYEIDEIHLRSDMGLTENEDIVESLIRFGDAFNCSISGCEYSLLALANYLSCNFLIISVSRSTNIENWSTTMSWILCDAHCRGHILLLYNNNHYNYGSQITGTHRQNRVSRNVYEKFEKKLPVEYVHSIHALGNTLYESNTRTERFTAAYLSYK
jgi:hypothetical protein